MPGAVSAAAATAATTSLGSVAFGVAVNAGISVGAAAFIGAAVSVAVTAAVTIGTSFALSSVSRAIGGKPDTGSLSSGFGGRTQTVKQAISPRKVAYGKTRVAGTLTFLYMTHNDGVFHMVVTLTGHPIDSFVKFIVDDQEQTLDSLGKPTGGNWNTSGSNPRVRIVGGTGTPAGDAAFQAAIQGNLPGVWTADHKQTGCAKIYIMGATNNFPNGLPNVTAVIKGKNDIYDPRISSSGYTNTAALCIRDYLKDQNIGFGAPDDEINDTLWNAEANICDEAVPLNGGGSEERYTINGSFLVNASFKPVLERLLSACAGTLTYQGGEFALYTGVYRTPVITFNENHLRGSSRVQAGIGIQEAFNGVKGTFINPDEFYQETPFPPITNVSYLAADGNERIWKPGDAFFPFTNSSARCQRLAKIDLERARQEITEAVPVSLEGLRLQVGDTIGRTHASRGWSAKPFEIKDWNFVNRGGQAAPRLGVDLVLRETVAAVYDWNSGEETVLDPAPNTNLPNPFSITAPTNLAVVSDQPDNLFFGADGTVLTRLKATWVKPVNTFHEKVETQFKLSSDSAWMDGPSVSDGQQAFLGPVTDNMNYDVRVRAVNDFGFKSAWVPALNHIVVGKKAKPSAPDTFNIEVGADGTRIYSWTHASPPADVRSGGGYKIRYKLGVETDWDLMTDLKETGLLIASPYEDNQLAAGTYTLAIKTVDSSKNESVEAKFISSAALSNPRIGEALLQRNERVEGWPGVLASCFINSEIQLEAESNGDYTNLPASWDGLADEWRKVVPNKSPIEYTTPEIDLGGDFKFRPLVSVNAEGTVTITMQTGTAADGQATGAFVTLDTVTARYIKIKISVADAYPLIRSMVTVLDAPSKTETYEDVDTSLTAGAPVWFERTAAGHFKIATKGEIVTITQARVNAIQNVGPGWTWELISKTAVIGSLPAAEFKLYNGSGTLADAVVDIVLRGAKE